MRRAFLRTLFLLLVLSVSPPPSLLADEIDWSGIRGVTVTLFYPGMSSWDFLLSEDHKLGAKMIEKGTKECARCHLDKSGELDLLADDIADGTARMKRSQRPFEDSPLPGKKGVLHASVKAAYDQENLYILVEWESKGTGWFEKREKADSIPDRVTLQVNKSVESFSRYGCFITCHNDQSSMLESPSKEKVLEHPYYKRLERGDVRLYANYTRNTNWADMKDQAEIDRLMGEGGLIDVWSVELKDKAARFLDGWVLEDRRWDEKSDTGGSGSWNGNGYRVLIKRPLKTKDPRDVQMEEGDYIHVGVAIHDDRAEKRKHYVSFPMRIGIGSEGDIEAFRLSP